MKNKCVDFGKCQYVVCLYLSSDSFSTLSFFQSLVNLLTDKEKR